MRQHGAVVLVALGFVLELVLALVVANVCRGVGVVAIGNADPIALVDVVSLWISIVLGAVVSIVLRVAVAHRIVLVAAVGIGALVGITVAAGVEGVSEATRCRAIPKTGRPLRHSATPSEEPIHARRWRSAPRGPDVMCWRVAASVLQGPRSADGWPPVSLTAADRRRCAR